MHIYTIGPTFLILQSIKTPVKATYTINLFDNRDLINICKKNTHLFLYSRNWEYGYRPIFETSCSKGEKVLYKPIS